MGSIEFHTTIENDGIITIPAEIGADIPKGPVRVVVTAEERPFLTREEIYDRQRDRAEGFISYLMRNPVKVDKQVPFLTREELHDRNI